MDTTNGYYEWDTKRAQINAAFHSGEVGPDATRQELKGLGLSANDVDEDMDNTVYNEEYVKDRYMIKVLDALRSAEIFVDSHSEEWYKPGQAILQEIRGAIAILMKENNGED